MPRRAPSRRRSTNGPGQRRKLVWARQHEFANVFPASVDLLALFRTELDWSGTPGITLMRLRVDLLVLNATPQDTSVLLGAIRWNLNAVTADLPSPQDDPGADWLAYGRFYAGGAGGNSTHYSLDVRSMRKLEELQQTIFLVLDTPPAEDGTTVTATTSALLALP